ncbi:CBS domain-containing protein [Sphaerimonospora thailandensis]|uniref:Signal transduction protein n=1 Tax=Sphaerimonospora thailandensis TaxID=795644 RepID=A0A8J3RBY0_9ACTN|nr:CBS domain-containing protein [Sphaerimonospora thailandensis]GIH71790.1 signal transduction protein [Sphaerimonospora thailandensis]
MQVKEIMTAPVVTVAEDTPVPAVAALLRSRRISAVPVVDAGGAVVGLVSDYDLLARQGATAAEVMTSAVICVTEDTDVDEVRHLLVDRRIRRVPVLAGGRLVGIVSRSDVVVLLTTEWACAVCGEVTRGERPPPRCPKCQAEADRFAPQEPLPGS